VSIEALVLREPVSKVGIYGLQNRIIRSPVVPIRPVHDVLHPLRINRAEFTVHVPNQVAMPTLSEINSIALTLYGFVQAGVCNLWVQTNGDKLRLATGIKNPDGVTPAGRSPCTAFHREN
jgi:hypothetical protein